MRARCDSRHFAKTFSKRFHEIHHFGGWLGGFSACAAFVFVQGRNKNSMGLERSRHGYDLFAGTFFPFLPASESPMAMACLRLFTVPPLPPLPRLRVPFLRRSMALLTFFDALFEYLRAMMILP
jgi:hypothetical protein